MTALTRVSQPRRRDPSKRPESRPNGSTCRRSIQQLRRARFQSSRCIRVQSRTSRLRHDMLSPVPPNLQGMCCPLPVRRVFRVRSVSSEAVRIRVSSEAVSARVRPLWLSFAEPPGVLRQCWTFPFPHSPQSRAPGPLFARPPNVSSFHPSELACLRRRAYTRDAGASSEQGRLHLYDEQVRGVQRDNVSPDDSGQ